MKVFFWDDILNSNIEDSPCFKYFTGSAITIGGFDGPHIGHKVLCDRVLGYAKKNNKQSGVITFAHSPRMAKERNSYAGDISTLRLKLKTFEKWGFDFVVVIDFSANFSKIRGAIFLKIIADHCCMQFLTVGEGFRCGYKGETDTAQIETFAQENNIVFLIAPLIHEASHTISSSVVRQFIVSGKLSKAENLLSTPYTLDLQDVPYEAEKATDGYCIQIKRQDIRQVLPPVGEYTVDVFIKDTSEQFSSSLRLDNINLRLNVQYESKNKQFDVITFG